MMKITDYSYHLPKELIARAPKIPRDNSRLLIYSSQNQEITHDCFYNLINYLDRDDLLIFNNSKVLPARLFGKKTTGGKIEILLLNKINNYWQVLIGGKVKIGEKIIFDDNLFCIVKKRDGKEVRVEFNQNGSSFLRAIEKIGHMPIPPYIKDTKLNERELRKKYQTVYAKKIGSAAAPTAGLHFTKKLIGEMKKSGVKVSCVDLQIGLGTFAPLSEKNILENRLHKENFFIPHSAVRKIFKTKKSKNRILAVGTTTVRAIESVSNQILKADNSQSKNISGSTDIFIYPGYEFKIPDSLITNFHLPCSSLMMLVAAFLEFKGVKDGRKKLLELYSIAIREKYRFYSFGDAMLIL